MILVSACLLGKNCRYDGGNCENKEIIESLKDKEYLEICPEMMGGLSCPRKPSERLNDQVVAIDGELVTAQFQKGAEEALTLARRHHCTMAILKEESPSCGVKRIHDGRFVGNIVCGIGVTAELLAKEGIQIISSEDFEQKSKQNL